MQSGRSSGGYFLVGMQVQSCTLPQLLKEKYFKGKRALGRVNKKRPLLPCVHQVNTEGVEDNVPPESSHLIESFGVIEGVKPVKLLEPDSTGVKMT